MKKLIPLFLLSFVLFSCEEQAPIQEEINPDKIYDEMKTELMRLESSGKMTQDGFINVMDEVAGKYGLTKEENTKSAIEARVDCERSEGWYISGFICVTSYIITCDYGIMCENCGLPFDDSDCVTVYW